MSRLELVSVISTDKLRLPGLLYSPAQETTSVAIWLHGMGDNGIFYKQKLMNVLGHSLNQRNIALLAFNNRGAHSSKLLRITDDSIPEKMRTYLGGTYYEKITDCVKDIDGAVTFLLERGYRNFYLLGHSSGANKICVYEAHSRDNPFKKYVLASPGDDVGLFYSTLRKKKFWEALSKARQLIREGKPLHVMPQYSGMHPFSAQSSVDILDPDGDYNTFPYYEAGTERLGKKKLFNEFSQIDRPTLVIFGEQDEWSRYEGNPRKAIAMLKKHLNPKAKRQSGFVVIPQADHSFHDHEIQLAEEIALWLTN